VYRYRNAPQPSSAGIASTVWGEPWLVAVQVAGARGKQHGGVQVVGSGVLGIGPIPIRRSLFFRELRRDTSQ
jgi:hypothetical protein